MRISNTKYFRETMKLIDARSISKKLMDKGRSSGGDAFFWLSDAVVMIANEPTVESEPIVYGKWLPNDIPGSELSKCSVCGFDTGAWTYKRCPECGAHMHPKMEDNSNG